MSLLTLDPTLERQVDRFLDILEKSLTHWETGNKNLSPGPYCCECGTHLCYVKEHKNGYYCPKCEEGGDLT